MLVGVHISKHLKLNSYKNEQKVQRRMAWGLLPLSRHTWSLLTFSGA